MSLLLASLAFADVLPDQTPAPTADAATPAPEAPPTREAVIQSLLDQGVAQAEAEKVADMILMEASLAWKTGDLPLRDGLATLHLGDSLRYLDPADANKIIQAWGNPPTDTLGMIFPADLGPFDEGNWAVVVNYVEDGHVDDSDAAEIDYAELLTQMQEDTRAANPERQKLGLTPLELKGWAEPPHYDATNHRLYWAQELASPEDSTLNYEVRVLGRKGVLSLNAVASMDQLPAVKTDMEKVMSQVEFTTGNTYADFDPDIDQVAAYGIGALVAGKLAAKAGFFAILLKGLLAAKKLVIVGIVALGAFLKRIFGKSDAQQA